MQAFFKIEPGTGKILGIYNEREPGSVWYEVNPDIGERPWAYKHTAGGFVQTDEFMIQNRKHDNLVDFKTWRSEQLHKYDVLGICIARGDKDPKTGNPYGPITEEERNFRVAILNFTEQITDTTSAGDYPIIPERIRSF